VNGAIAGPITAVLIGVLLSYVEVYNKRGAMPRREVAGWAVFRISVDSSICLATFPAAMLMFPGGQWWWAAVASGVGAPVLLRSQVKFIGKGGNAKDFGLEVLYGKLRDWIDGKIDRRTSSIDSAWVINEAAPYISRIPAGKLLARIEGYYKLLERASGVKTTAQFTYIKKMIGGSTANDVTVGEAVVFQLLFYGHRELVESLIKESDSWASAEQDATSDDQNHIMTRREEGRATRSAADGASPASRSEPVDQ
jgi:hypothetical protein